MLVNNAPRLHISSMGNVGIGTTTPNEQLEITGNLRLPTTTATTGIIKSGSSTLIHNFGTNNFFAGENAGNLTTTGFENTGIGVSALQSNTTGQSNTAIGYNALTNNSIGQVNTATGRAALSSNTTGNGNTATGVSALSSNTTGQQNTAMGSSALSSNTTGNTNTAIGGVALSLNTTGNNNTAIGYQANVGGGNLTNATAIGAFAQVATSNSMVLGGLGLNAVNVGIGTTSPAARLDVRNFGTEDILNLFDVSTEVLTVLDGGNVGIGTTSPVQGLHFGGSNIALDNLNLTAFSRYVGIAGTNGTIIPGMSGGSQIEFESRLNDDNLIHFLTHKAGSSHARRMTIDENGNVAIGTTSPVHRLDVVGGALRVTGASFDNTQIRFAGATDGELYAIGTDVSTNNGTNSWEVFDLANNAARLHISSTGNVGIGTTSPQGSDAFSRVLEIANDASTARPVLRLHRPSAVEYKIGVEDLDNKLYIVNSNGNVLPRSGNGIVMDANGNVGIGTASATALLSVNGSANKLGGGNWGVFSDIRLKKDISSFADGLGLVNQINPVWFRYNGKGGLATDKRYVGVIAQEIEKIAPYLIEKKMVNESGTEEEYLEYDGSAMDFILINAIKEQQKIIAAQNAELKRMKTQLAEFDSMKSRMATIEAALQKMEIRTAKADSSNESSTSKAFALAEGDNER